jgi:hypothetical protein
MCLQSPHVLFRECYKFNPSTPEFHENLVVANRVESDRHISASSLVDEEHVS